MRRAVIGALAGTVLAMATPAFAEIPGDLYSQAVATVRQYASEMTDMLPCAAMGYAGIENGEKVLDDTYGVPAVTKAIGDFVEAHGGSFGDTVTLLSVFTTNAAPNYVRDIRELGKFCGDKGYLRDLELFSGAAVPLSARAPFNEH